MDNFTGLFEDGELGNLDLSGESFVPTQGPANAAVPEMDITNFSQTSFNDINTVGSGSSLTTPTQMGNQGTIKMTIAQQPSQQQIGSYPGPTQPFQYTQNTPTQYVGAPQFRAQYTGQDIYAQRSAMQTNPNISSWNNSADHFPQTPGNYQQHTPQSQSSFPQSGVNFTGQNVSGNAVNTIQGNMPHNFQSIPSQSSLNTSYPTASQSIPFQGAPRPPYPNFDPQRAVRPGTQNMSNFSEVGRSVLQGHSQQQYPVMQNPRQSYHVAHYQNQVAVGTSSSSPQQQQISTQKIMCGTHSPQGDLTQFSNSQMPNGTPYRAPFPQLSPQMTHSQGSPHPQLSPMARSLSPHTRTNSNLSIASPVSSPVSIPNSSASPNSNSGLSAAANIQHMENIVKPSGAGRNTPTNSNCSTPTHQPLHSPGLYGNANVNSPLGQRAPISPGIISRSVVNSNPLSPGVGGVQPSMSPQQWTQTRNMNQQNFIQNNVNQSLMNVQISSHVPSSLPHLANVRSQEQMVNDSSSPDSNLSVRDSLNPIGSAIGLSNGPVNSSLVLNISTQNLESGCIQVPNSLNSEVSNSSGMLNTISVRNGTLPSNDSIPGQYLSHNVPPTLSPGGVPCSQVSSTESQVTPSGSVPPNSLVQGIKANIGTNVENGLSPNPACETGSVNVPHCSSSTNSMSGSSMPCSRLLGNTMTKFSGLPQRPHVTLHHQSCNLVDPRAIKSQGSNIASELTHQPGVNNNRTQESSMSENSGNLSGLTSLQVCHSSTGTVDSQTGINKESTENHNISKNIESKNENLLIQENMLNENLNLLNQQTCNLLPSSITSTHSSAIENVATDTIVQSTTQVSETQLKNLVVEIPELSQIADIDSVSQKTEANNHVGEENILSQSLQNTPIGSFDEDENVIGLRVCGTSNTDSVEPQSTQTNQLNLESSICETEKKEKEMHNHMKKDSEIKPTQPISETLLENIENNNSTSVQGPLLKPQLNLSIEINHCQQEIQQMLKLPQNDEAQQKV